MEDKHITTSRWQPQNLVAPESLSLLEWGKCDEHWSEGQIFLRGIDMNASREGFPQQEACSRGSGFSLEDKDTPVSPGDRIAPCKLMVEPRDTLDCSN